MAGFAFECSICMDDFKTPKMIPCGHSFCLCCLQQLTASKFFFVCPNCCRQFSVPHAGVESYPTNYSLVNPRYPTTQSRGKCPSHTKREIEVYCKDCQVGVCSICVLKSHKDHAYIILEDHTDEILQDFKNARENITELCGNLDKDLSILKDVRATLNVHKDKAIETATQIITRNFDTNSLIITKMVDLVEDKNDELKVLLEQTQAVDNSTIDMLKLMSKVERIENQTDKSKFTLPKLEYITFHKTPLVDCINIVPYQFPKFQVIQNLSTSNTQTKDVPAVIPNALKECGQNTGIAAAGEKLKQQKDGRKQSLLKSDIEDNWRHLDVSSEPDNRSLYSDGSISPIDDDPWTTFYRLQSGQNTGEAAAGEKLKQQKDGRKQSKLKSDIEDNWRNHSYLDVSSEPDNRSLHSDWSISPIGDDRRTTTLNRLQRTRILERQPLEKKQQQDGRTQSKLKSYINGNWRNHSNSDESSESSDDNSNPCPW